MFEELEKLCANLVYVSEIDAPVSAYHYRRESLPFYFFELRDFNEFMKIRVALDEAWQPLYEFMAANLENLRIVKTGSINVEIYGVGTSDGETYGFRTYGVET